MTRRIWPLLLLCCLLAGPASAVEPGERLEDPVLEGRARALSQELRCLVCQNQSIDDSDAPLARDLRGLVRERLAAGDSDSQVLDYIVARYGEFVLLRPPFSVQTWALWAGPFIILFLGTVAVLLLLRRGDRKPREAPLSDTEKARLQEIMNKADDGDA